MNSPDTDPLDEIPEECLRILEESDDTQLREIIDHAQRLLRDKTSLTDAIESREGEDLIRIEDHGAYTLVIAERVNETGKDRGPFAYHIRWDPETDDKEADTSGIIWGEHTMIRETERIGRAAFHWIIASRQRHTPTYLKKFGIVVINQPPLDEIQLREIWNLK